jgi:branched-chain amino acid transport system ATP-binding protein
LPDLLELVSVRAGYGEAVAVKDVSLTLKAGEAMAVLGRNGAGKTSLLNTIVGVTRHFGGTIRLDGQDITKFAPEARARAGIGWVPQERNIFKSLSVEENLTAVALPGPWNVQRAYELFPRLKERRTNPGTHLSGGEQQMLAVARALMLNPKVLLLDEPTEGLAPIIVQELLNALGRILREEGMAAIVVEQHAQKVLKITDRAIIVGRGSVVHKAASAALRNDGGALEKYLGLGDGAMAASA